MLISISGYLYTAYIHPLQIISTDLTLNGILSFLQKSGHFQNTEEGQIKMLKKKVNKYRKIKSKESVLCCHLLQTLPEQ